MNSRNKIVNIIRLHTHWLIANRMNEVMKHTLKDDKIISETIKKSNSFKGNLSDNQIEELLSEHNETMRILFIFYALIYVVIEGYIECKFKDDKIEIFLQEKEKVNTLKNLRNALFHHQKNKLFLDDPKIGEFLVIPDTEIWIKKIHNRLGSFLIEEGNKELDQLVKKK